MLEVGPRVPWRVSDLKQYVYCPRILYYHACLPRVRPITYKMQAGINAQLPAEGRERRRSLRAYGLEQGQRHFNVPLVSERLGLRGQVDLVIETEQSGEPEAIPVDYQGAFDMGSAGLKEVRLWVRINDGAWESTGLAAQGADGQFAYSLPGGQSGTTCCFALQGEDYAGNVSAVPKGIGHCQTVLY